MKLILVYLLGAHVVVASTVTVDSSCLYQPILASATASSKMGNPLMAFSLD